MKQGWETVAIGDVCTSAERWESPIPGCQYRQIGVRLWGNGAYEREPLDGGDTKYKSLNRVQAGDIIVNKIWARNGSVTVVDSALSGCFCSGEFPLFEPARDRLEPRWFHLITKKPWFWQCCDVQSRGTSGKNRIRPEKFLEITIPLPPLSEQRRIVAKVEELAGKIEEARWLRANTLRESDALFAASLFSAFIPCVDDDAHDTPRSAFVVGQSQIRTEVSLPNYNNAHFHEPKVYEKAPYRLPKTWTWTDLGSVLTHIVDCVNDTPEFSCQPTQYLGLKSTNVRPYRLDLSERWYMTAADFAMWNRRESPKAGDILLTREAPMGNACIVPAGIQSCLTQRIMLLRPYGQAVVGTYLLHFLNSSHFRRQVTEMCRGLTTPHIRVKDVPGFLLPLPPLPEQRRIVAYLDDLQAKVDALKVQQAQSAAELDALLPSILDKGFKGEL